MRSHLVLVVVVASVAMSPRAFAAEKAWDQQAVTQIVRELDGAVTGLLDEFKKQPPANLASMQADARLRLEDDLRRLEHETHGLRERIDAGAGLDATRSMYEHIGSVANDAREEARKQMQAEPVLKRVDQAEALWARLTPYYVSAPKPQTTSKP
ncbi:MAG TPA: hypothetical protein VMW19_18340 [Myxococcota bacterium]|nr:hypothetical protein [Myxococcota bacterium]